MSYIRLSKAEFCNYMDEFRNLFDAGIELCKATDGDTMPFVDSYLSMLERLCGDEGNGWIAWWVFECDFGREGDKTCRIKLEDGTPLLIKTPEALYDLLSLYEYAGECEDDEDEDEDGHCPCCEFI